MYGRMMYIKWHMQTISGYGNLTRTLQDDRKKHEIKWKHIDIYVVMQKKSSAAHLMSLVANILTLTQIYRI